MNFEQKNMRTKFSITILAILTNVAIAQTDSAVIKKIFNEALSNGKSYSNLDYLTNKIGGRLSGSPQAQQAVEWAFKAMKEAGADTVYMQECMVPHWIRGEKEVGKIISAVMPSIGVEIEPPKAQIGTSLIPFPFTATVATTGTPNCRLKASRSISNPRSVARSIMLSITTAGATVTSNTSIAKRTPRSS